MSASSLSNPSLAGLNRSAAPVPSGPSARQLWQRWQEPVRRWWPPCAVALWCVILFWFGLSAGDLYRTEGLRAIIGQEMLQSGNWLVPRLYGEPLFTKPPIMYIAIALCGWPFGGVTDWSARIPSALAATVTVILFYTYFKRRLGQMPALIAALILPMAPMWLDKATSAEMDMMQAAWVTASLLFLFRAVEEHERQGSPRTLWFWWSAALLCMSGGLLTKWTAPAFFYATAITLLGRRGKLNLLCSRYHLVSAALAGLVCLSWVAAAVALEGWDVFHATVEREALARLVPNYAAPYPWWETLYHPLVVFINTLPWSLVALWALRPGFADLCGQRDRRVLQEMHCWLWPNLIIFSLLAEHTPRHSFPIFPAIAGLAAVVWTAWLGRRLSWPSRRVSPGKVLIGALAVWVLFKTLLVCCVVPRRSHTRQAAAKGALLAGWVPADVVLYLFGVKDEGVMFYYGRPVVRLPSPEQLPAPGQPLYCILTRGEWEQWRARPAEVIGRFTDQQGAPLVLIRCTP